MQNTLPLTKQEQAYLDNLIDRLSKKSKVSDTQNLILELNKKSKRSDIETQKLRLLLKSEKIREEDLENKRLLQATLKAEKEQVRQTEQRRENTIGKKIIYAIREDILLGKDYPYSKLLKKMVIQGLFSEEEQELLAEFLVESVHSSDSSTENNSVYSDSGENKLMMATLPQNDIHQTDTSNEARDKNSVVV